MTDLDLAAIRASLEAAIPGPWHLETDSCDCGDGYGCPHGAFPYAIWLPVHKPGALHRECDTATSACRYDHLASEVSDLTMETAEFIASAPEDVAALLAEVDRLTRALADVEALTRDTDGGDVDSDAEIPVGEIRRVTAHPPTDAPIAPANSPDTRRTSVSSQPQAGDTVGTLSATLAAAEADGWHGWMCCEHHENRANGLPCHGACCDDCPHPAAAGADHHAEERS